ncbi:MAG: hypothetical protein HYY03_05190, partial [Chloroflexi bacterium]|nr:hypothetical protein [Chloroflexota bacterium]
MPEAAWSDPSQADPRRETRVPSPPLTADQNAAVQPISIADVFAETRQGFVVRIARWDDSAASQLGRLEGDFRIAVLDEPPPAPIQPPPATIVCAPARPLEGTPAVRETAVPNGISRPEPLLTPAALRLLGQGKLYAHAELRITAQDAFADGQSRFDLLARELLTCEALARYLDPMAVALWAPDTPRRTSAEQRLAALGVLLRGAQAALPEAGPSAEAAAALDRISQLCAATDAESFLVSAHALYPHVPAFLEDIYLLRALAERPAEAREVLAMRAFIAQAALPPGDSDLSLDRAIADEQLQFASLVPEPQRLNAA